jgi:hypothetical protein
MEDRLQRFNEPFIKPLAASAVALFCFACSDGNSAPFSTNAPAEHESVAVPSGAQQWTVDTSKEKLAIMGWGVLDQLGQVDGLGVQTNTPAWMAAAVEAFFDAGLTWIGMEISLGMLSMDADYWTPYLNIGLPHPPGTTQQGAAFYAHMADPVWGGSFSNLAAYLNWKLAFITALRTEARSRGITLKIYVKIGDNPNPSLAWYYDTSQYPSRYGDGVLALFQWLAANKGWTPDAIDVMNEPGTAGNAWSTSELLAAVNDMNTKLLAKGYSPYIIGPSYDGSSNFNQTIFDAWHNAGVANGWLARWWPSTHHYTDNGDADLRLNMATFASTLAASRQTIGETETEDVMTALGILTFLQRGAGVGSMNYTAATRYQATFDGGRRNSLWYGNTDGTVTPRYRTIGLIPIFQALPPGRILVDVVNRNLVDADNAELVAAKHPSTGKLTIVMVDNTGGVAKYVKGIPAGTYSLTWQLYSITATENLRAPTLGSQYIIGSAQTGGVTYAVDAGEGIYLNELVSNAAGIFVLRQL